MVIYKIKWVGGSSAIWVNGSPYSRSWHRIDAPAKRNWHAVKARVDILSPNASGIPLSSNETLMADEVWLAMNVGLRWRAAPLDDQGNTMPIGRNAQKSGLRWSNAALFVGPAIWGQGRKNKSNGVQVASYGTVNEAGSWLERLLKRLSERLLIGSNSVGQWKRSQRPFHVSVKSRSFYGKIVSLIFWKMLKESGKDLASDSNNNWWDFRRLLSIMFILIN